MEWGRGLLTFFGLGAYWATPWLLLGRVVRPPDPRYALVPALFGAGVFLHSSADMQKDTALLPTPDQRISDGLFARARHVNCLGSC